MTELILPDLLDDPPPLEVVHCPVKHHVKPEPLRRNVHARHKDEEHEGRGLREYVVHQHLFILRLLHRHPRALKREVADVMTREQDDEVLPPDERLDDHGTPPRFGSTVIMRKNNPQPHNDCRRIRRQFDFWQLDVIVMMYAYGVQCGTQTCTHHIWV